jgi:hypothetical protein
MSSVIDSVPLSIFSKIREFLSPFCEESNTSGTSFDDNIYEFKNWRNFLHASKSIWNEVRNEYTILNINRNMCLSDFQKINEDSELWSRNKFAVHNSKQQIFLNFSPKNINIISFPTEPEFPYDELLAQKGLKPFDVNAVYIQTVCLLVNLHPFSNVTFFYLCDCPSIVDVSPLKNVPFIYFYCCQNIEDVSSLSNCKRLMLDKTSVKDVSQLKNVRWLYLSYCHKIQDISGLKNVYSLVIESCGGVKLFPHFEGTHRFHFIINMTTSAQHNFDLVPLSNIPFLSIQSQSSIVAIKYSNGLRNDSCFEELTLSGCNSSVLSSLSPQNIKKLIILEELPSNYSMLEGFENIQFSFLRSTEVINVFPTVKRLKLFYCLKVTNITAARNIQADTVENADISLKKDSQLRELVIYQMRSIPIIDFLSFPNLINLYLHDIISNGKTNTSKIVFKHVQPMKYVYLENCDIYIFNVYQSIEKFQIIKGKCFSRINDRISIHLYEKANINKILIDGHYYIEEIVSVQTEESKSKQGNSCRIN